MPKAKPSEPEEKPQPFSLEISTDGQPIRVTISHESHIGKGPDEPSETFWVRQEIPFVLPASIGQVSITDERVIAAMNDAAAFVSRMVGNALALHKAEHEYKFEEPEEKADW
jgi:hypothetical protein